MKVSNVENVRIVMKTEEFIKGYHFGIFPHTERAEKDFWAIYGIDENRYSMNQIFYKIGLESKNHSVPSKSFYTDDLKNILKENKKSKEKIMSGFYEVSSINDVSLDNVNGKIILIDMPGCNNKFDVKAKTPETVIRVEKLKKIFGPNKVRLTNLTVAKEDSMELSVEEFDEMMMVVNPRAITMLDDDWLEQKIEESYIKVA